MGQNCKAKGSHLGASLKFYRYIDFYQRHGQICKRQGEPTHGELGKERKNSFGSSIVGALESISKKKKN